MYKNHKIAVVIPCFKVKRSISKVVKTLPSYIDFVFLVNDNCPENSTEHIFLNKKIKILRNKTNKGVGGAMIKGYLEAKKKKYNIDIIVKIDGDGQMNSKNINRFIEPLIKMKFDYCKGNRFASLKNLKQMPNIRIIGNFFCSVLGQISCGYFNIFDFNNGFTAINKRALIKLNLSKIDNSFFFENDMLFNLFLSKARVKDIPINSKYKNEKSNISIFKILLTFPFKYAKNFLKRIFKLI